MDKALSFQSKNVPVRPQASPRPSPPSSPDSSTSINVLRAIDELGDESFTCLNSVQCPRRGRTLHRIPAQSRLVSRATTRRRKEYDLADLQWRECSSLYDFTKPPDELDYSLLEPLPLQKCRVSLSEELYRAATFKSSIDVTRFARHRDTFAMLGLRQLQHRRPALPLMVFAQIAPYLDFDTYKAVRLTCRSWSMAVSGVRPTKLPPVLMLPSKMLERIYIELSPLDFNAARRTCRAWMMASLEETLLLLMAKRGGWSGAILADREVKAEQDLEYRMTAISDNWLLGKRLATECSLGPGWSGSGVNNMRTTITGLQLTSELDFSQLSTAPSQPGKDGSQQSTRFTVSNCSRFLLAYHACTIHIYALRGSPGDGNVQPFGGHMEPWSTILCPAHVLAVSMDTSSHRYAVAALLQGSIGIVCDVSRNEFSTPQLFLKYVGGRCATDNRGQGSVLTPWFPDEHIARNATIHSFNTVSTVFGAPTDHSQACAIAKAPLFNSQSLFRSSTVQGIGGESQPPLTRNRVSHTYTPSNGYAGDGSQTVYRNLCCLDDPPRSVAICPQRHCVAFGCRRGVELHWVDSLTGQDLKRWFPLPPPSDFLFFMPSRGMDSSVKLRLISSAMPDDASRNPRENHPAYDNRTEGTIHCDIRPGPYDNRNSKSEAYSGYCRALPLSDGYHVLFRLPGSRELYVGREDPLGPNFGKLAKKVIFIGPKDEHGITMLPRLYAAATEMRWGLRVAVAYSDQLWFFIVPPDLLLEYGIQGKDLYASTATQYDSTAPLQVAGAKVATIVGLESLALDASAGDLTLWAFSRNAKAYVFQLAGRNLKAVTQRAAMSDGTIILTRDIDGDTIMTEAPCVVEDPCLGSDGTTSLCHHHNSPSSLVPCLPACSHRYCNLLLYGDSSPFIKSNEPPFSSSCTQLSEDEGYASADDDQYNMADRHFAIHVPPVLG